VTRPAPPPAPPPPSSAGRGAVRRVLVAGVGNLFLTDDGFGPEVARQLARQLPRHGGGGSEGVRVTDYGIRGMHLAFDLLDRWDRLILIDLLPSRGQPGTVHVIEIDGDTAGHELVGRAAPDPHGMAPHAVLAAVGSLGGRLPPTVLVGCEPADIGEGLGLTARVAAAVPPAVEAVLAILDQESSSSERAGSRPLPAPTSGGQ